MSQQLLTLSGIVQGGQKPVTNAPVCTFGSTVKTGSRVILTSIATCHYSATIVGGLMNTKNGNAFFTIFCWQKTKPTCTCNTWNLKLSQIGCIILVNPFFLETIHNFCCAKNKKFQFLVIGQCGDALFFANQWLHVHVSAIIGTRTKCPHTQSIVKSFKRQHGRIPIDPAIFAAIGRQNLTPKKRKLKMCESEETRNRRNFCLGGPYRTKF